MEILQLVENPGAYFFDYWNVIDFCSLSMNITYVSMVLFILVTHVPLMPIIYLRLFGALACFFMWIKIFYWMRLFRSTAYYVKLIAQTIEDCLTFTLMVFIILLAFTSFFYILNMNLEGTKDAESYARRYVGDHSHYANALLTSYLIYLGEFKYGKFSKGPNKYSVWVMFVLCSFLTNVVFMNMLIAIMGKTFEDVNQAMEENMLKE